MITIDYIRPRELLNDYLYRLGNPKGDGGYAVPYNVMKQTDVLYSYGVGDNSSFENDYTNITSKPAHLYDHTVNCNPTYIQHSFHKEGLSGTLRGNPDEGITNNYLYHLKENGDEGKNVLLKIDVEGAEYEWLRNTDINELSKSVSLLVIEFHNAHAQIAGSLDRVFDKYNVVHWHCNNFGGIINNFPSVPEITFLRKDISLEGNPVVGSLVSNKEYPILGLDIPNNGVRDDYTWKY